MSLRSELSDAPLRLSPPPADARFVYLDPHSQAPVSVTWLQMMTMMTAQILPIGDPHVLNALYRSGDFIAISNG